VNSARILAEPRNRKDLPQRRRSCLPRSHRNHQDPARSRSCCRLGTASSASLRRTTSSAAAYREFSLKRALSAPSNRDAFSGARTKSNSKKSNLPEDFEPDHPKSIHILGNRKQDRVSRGNLFGALLAIARNGQAALYEKGMASRALRRKKQPSAALVSAPPPADQMRRSFPPASQLAGRKTSLRD